MNAMLTLILLFMALITLHHHLWVMYVALVVAAIFSAPSAWPYIVLAGVIMYLLQHFSLPSWELLSVVVIAVLFSVMAKLEERRREIPPELLYYLMMGGGRAP